MVSLTPGLSTMRFGELRILCFLGRVFGNQRFLSEWLSFCGQLLMVEFLLWIISCLGVALWQIGVVCVIVMESRWTTFLFIVLLHTLWTFMLQAFGIHWVMPGSVAGLLSCWHQWLGKHNSDIWNFVPGCLKWIVWLERNRRSFKDREDVG